MNKVYLVTTGDYSSYNVVAAFSTKEKADSMADLVLKAITLNKDYMRVYVEEYEIDREFGEYTKYYLSISRNGDTIDIYNEMVCLLEVPQYFLIDDYNNPGTIILRYIAIANSEEQAVKSANEVRTQLIALNKWG